MLNHSRCICAKLPEAKLNRQRPAKVVDYKMCTRRWTAFWIVELSVDVHNEPPRSPYGFIDFYSWQIVCTILPIFWPVFRFYFDRIVAAVSIQNDFQLWQMTKKDRIPNGIYILEWRHGTPINSFTNATPSEFHLKRLPNKMAFNEFFQ